MNIRTEKATVAATATFAFAAVAWIVALQRMNGMDMGAATALGSLAFFITVWVPMMTAMMLPGAIPALLRRTSAEHPVRAIPVFAGSYVVVWALVGFAVYFVYRPHGAVVAGVLTVAAGVYELTPLKRRCRERCREDVRSGARFGLYCVGSSIGLMVLLVALGVMSVTWMAVVAVVVLAQKLLPPRASIDVPLALAIVGLGIVTATT